MSCEEAGEQMWWLGWKAMCGRVWGEGVLFPQPDLSASFAGS